MKRRRVAMTISIPPEIKKDYEWLTQKEAKKSQLFRDMFLLYKEQSLEKEFFELQRYGAKLAKLKGILREKDVEKIVFEGRCGDGVLGRSGESEV